MRDEKGRFKKGFSSSPETQFKKGQHWRTPQIFRNKDWLIENYINRGKSSGDIAKEFDVTEAAIIFWLKKHGIPRRTSSEVRAIKHWGMFGSDNPMWNKKGELNSRWLGGVSPERQTFYSSGEWKKVCRFVWKRDNATCKRCGMHRTDDMSVPFHIHHIVSFANKELRAEPSNLVLLCEVCHHFVHSKRNKNNEYIQRV